MTNTEVSYDSQWVLRCAARGSVFLSLKRDSKHSSQRLFYLLTAVGADPSLQSFHEYVVETGGTLQNAATTYFKVHNLLGGSFLPEWLCVHILVLTICCSRVFS